MSKRSFTAVFTDPSKSTDKEIILTGVTGIYPNMNGFLFCTEDRVNYQWDFNSMSIVIEYYDDEVIDKYLKEKLEEFIILDHRE